MQTKNPALVHKIMAQGNPTHEGNNNLFFPILLLLPLLFLIFKQLSKSPSPPLPPGPYSWPILGNIFQMGKNPHVNLAHLAQFYGPLFSLRLGTQLVVVGSTKGAAIEILKTHDRILSGRYVPHMAPTKNSHLNKLSLGWIVECNEKWKYLRTLCKTELFSCKALESQAWIRQEKIMDMVGFINKMEGTVVKIREVATATVFNMLSSILLSRDLISLDEESEDGGMSGVLKGIAELFSTPNISDFYPILGPLDLQGLRKRTMELHRRVFDMCNVIIKERREGKRGEVYYDVPSRRDFLQTLISKGTSDEQINMLLLELLSAGTDASSTTIEWIMAELIKNPNCMRKVEEEIATLIANQNTILESHLPHLKYLQACVKETLRLHPSGPFLLPHRAIDSCQVMNYTIPKNTQVLVNFWAIGRDPKDWADPLVFNPERFLGSSLDFKGNDFLFIPFGSGRRICPGLTMAAKQLPLIVAALIHFFEWSLPCGMHPSDLDMTENYGLTLRKEQPLLLIPKGKILSEKS